MINFLLIVLSNLIISEVSTTQHFLKEPVNISAILGNKVLLPCEVKNKIGDCQWTKDGFGLGTDPDLPGFSRYSLDISTSSRCDLILDPVQPEDEGLYQCQVGAVPGVAALTSRLASVTVNHEPGLPFIIQSKHGDVMEVSEGEEIVLECESQGGKPAADIVWTHKDGTKVASKVVNFVTKMYDKRLFKTYSILKFVPLKDEEIMCKAFSKQFKQPRLSNGLLIRLKHKPRIELQFSTDKVIVGGSLEVLCKASASPLNIRFKWFINDVEIVGETSEVLTIDTIKSEDDSMKIKCIAENDVGVTEDIKLLNLNLQPKMIKHPETVFGRPYETLILSCQAEGNPPPSYIWVKGKSNQLVGIGQTLTLTVSESTEGEYVCKAISGDHQPSTVRTAKLVMKRKPRLKMNPTKPAVRGSDIIISCRVKNAHPGTQLVWAKKDQPIAEDNYKYKVVESEDKMNMEISSDLIIRRADTEDFTSYGCFASNELGSDYQMIDLVEEHDNYLTIALIVNISGVFLMLLIVGIVCVRRRKYNVQFMEQEKLRNLDYLNNQQIFKNFDRNVFDKLLDRNELVAYKDDFNIDMEFHTGDLNPEYEKRISSKVQNTAVNCPNVLPSPNDSLASNKTVLSFLSDGEET